MFIIFIKTRVFAIDMDLRAESGIFTLLLLNLWILILIDYRSGN